MATMRHTIEVDETTATLLRDRAIERGISVAELVASLAVFAEPSIDTTAEGLADLDRQMAAIDSGEEATYAHDDVARWLTTWGTPDFKPFPLK